MHALRLTFALLVLSLWAVQAQGQAAADSLQACRTRRVELSRKVAEFRGEARMKRLIEADLRRASQEEAEGDVSECTEALDHAAKLLAGNV